MVRYRTLHNSSGLAAFCDVGASGAPPASEL
eukprot:CAMPEP_0174385624 /NCGR_PEP_ID=MMETSP0811_2-20130205/126725_1 /TAXON_ID=73025 ORGANISM="Eutreptiella gymnastica-like, Strain CCMP1594" /NCGR_SAMPLE_ID=MMETSP0811_2 /ASSEMBLY_ACC=CAM_ASM_000667 /LENGTH=30 /DNA_ID= /DNA_START= /DNA_END= /DNA_ORIENTATION=